MCLDDEAAHHGIRDICVVSDLTEIARRFMNDRRVQELIYKHMTETPTQPQTVLNDIRVEAEHLRALLR